MPTRQSKSRPRGWRRGRGIGGTRIDPYQMRVKLPEPTCCPTCGAVWHKGRWSWAGRPAGAHEHECPACRRIRDGLPMGRVRLEGEFGARKQEILHLVRNLEATEKADHPLERIMTLSEEPWGLSITTTGIHLARRIAESLQRTWHEHVEIRYAKAEDLVRVTWRHAAPPARAQSRPREGGS